ncbi:hypothetical protein NL676_034817 [Syzygium grande]|nr:hypothetical protein NL676_034817 [Syzygium grande]
MKTSPSTVIEFGIVLVLITRKVHHRPRKPTAPKNTEFIQSMELIGERKRAKADVLTMGTWIDSEREVAKYETKKLGSTWSAGTAFPRGVCE